LQVGSDADLLLVDLEHTYTIEGGQQITRAKATPFEGMKGRGRLELVTLRGTRVWSGGAPCGTPRGSFIPATAPI
jgi:dihydroorotase-like cyclic amidohydrolase